MFLKSFNYHAFSQDSFCMQRRREVWLKANIHEWDVTDLMEAVPTCQRSNKQSRIWGCVMTEEPHSKRDVRLLYLEMALQLNLGECRMYFKATPFQGSSRKKTE